MGNRFHDAGHLIRLAIAVLLFAALFLLVRAAVIPKEFGKYGHYRPAAIEEIQNRQPVYAGKADCLLCHEDQAKALASGRHTKINCEACHGPQSTHANANDPAAHKPAKPDVKTLCANCHQKDSAKPEWFPQVSLSEHYEGACNSCHQPHQPKL